MKIEQIIENSNQMSSNTCTHHVYTNYHFKPSSDVTPPSVDHSMYDGFGKTALNTRS